MTVVTQISLALACAMSLAAAWTDAKTGKIPHRVTLPLLPVGMILGGVQSGLWGVVSAVLGALLCSAVPYVLFRVRPADEAAMGGGDLKLFAALGALLGPNSGLEVQLASLILLALFALLAVTWQGQLFALLQRTAWLSINWVLPKERRRPLAPELMLKMRMGPAICVATWGFATLQYMPTLTF